MYFGKKITAALKVALCGFIRDSFNIFRGMVFDETFHFFITVRIEDYLVLSDVFWKENGGRKKMLKCDFISDLLLYRAKRDTLKLLVSSIHK